jgi:hypothetical protein
MRKKEKFEGITRKHQENEGRKEDEVKDGRRMKSKDGRTEGG